MSMLAGFFPPMENLIPLTVVGTQSLPASTGPAGVLKYGETPFSLKLMPNPGPNLILPLISAIVLLGLIGRAVLLDQPISLPVDGIPPGVPVLPPVVARLAPLAILDGFHLHLKA